MAKKNQFNVPVNPDIAAVFDEWCNNYAGKKGEKLGAALIAIQALGLIDSNLVMRLMQPDVTPVSAKEIIKEAVKTVDDVELFNSLSPKDKAFLKEVLKGRE